jgi:Protein of unknown function (DUF499)
MPSVKEIGIGTAKEQIVNAITPWWDVLTLREEITDAAGSIDDVQMSLFQAASSTASPRPPYASATYYGEITHPSPLFIDLMAKVAVRLGGGTSYFRARALWRLDQAMGGGKSHGLIGLWHLASHFGALTQTDIGRAAVAEATAIIDGPLAADLGNPQVVVMACDNMTAGQGVAEHDGPARTLYERFLWRLFGGDNNLYLRYKDFNGDKSKMVEALTAVGRPVLILIDEIMDYIRQLSDTKNADLAVQDMAFLRALLDSVNDVKHVAAVVVMIASEKDSMDLDEAGQQRRSELDSLLIRNGETATINDNTDFAAILQRRLFLNSAPAEVLRATTQTFSSHMTGPWLEKIFNSIPAISSPEFADEVTRCYPFHPQLIALAELEWAKLAGFQVVRSTISIFAATAYSLYKRAKSAEWCPLLVGPGDLPLSDPSVREAIIGSGLISDSRTQANYRQIASADIVASDDYSGAARVLDRQRSDATLQKLNPRAAERAATCLFLCSIVGARAGGRQGATEAELKAAMFVPSASFPLAEADAVMGELLDVDGGGLASVEQLAGRGGQSPRLFMSTRQTLNMLFRAARASIDDADKDAELARTAERLSTSGPFKSKIFVEAELARSALQVLATAGIDDARSTRLVVLDPRQFSLLNGMDQASRNAVRAAMGIGADKLPVQWASSAVFAIVNTQRRGQARGAASSYLAWDRVAAMDAVRADEELADQARDQKAESKRNLEKSVRRAYQHIMYLGQAAESDHERVDYTITFEDDNQTGLDGTSVWKELVTKGKVFDTAAFDAKALLYNLNDSDYGRPLDEVRDLFWSAPRMPLLPSGDADLQRAIFEALQAGKIRLVGSDGLDRAVGRPTEIGVGQSSLRLAKPKAATLPNATESSGSDDASSPAESGASNTETDAGDAGEDNGGNERELAFTLMTSLSDETRRDAVRQLLRDIANAVDDGAASYTQISAKIIVDVGVVEDIALGVRAAGTTPTIREV